MWAAGSRPSVPDLSSDRGISRHGHQGAIGAGRPSQNEEGMQGAGEDGPWSVEQRVMELTRERRGQTRRPSSVGRAGSGRLGTRVTGRRPRLQTTPEATTPTHAGRAGAGRSMARLPRAAGGPAPARTAPAGGDAPEPGPSGSEPSASVRRAVWPGSTEAAATTRTTGWKPSPGPREGPWEGPTRARGALGHAAARPRPPSPAALRNPPRAPGRLRAPAGGSDALRQISRRPWALCSASHASVSPRTPSCLTE